MSIMNIKSGISQISAKSEIQSLAKKLIDPTTPDLSEDLKTGVLATYNKTDAKMVAIEAYSLVAVGCTSRLKTLLNITDQLSAIRNETEQAVDFNDEPKRIKLAERGLEQIDALLRRNKDLLLANNQEKIFTNSLVNLNAKDFVENRLSYTDVKSTPVLKAVSDEIEVDIYPVKIDSDEIKSLISYFQYLRLPKDDFNTKNADFAKASDDSKLGIENLIARVAISKNKVADAESGNVKYKATLIEDIQKIMPNQQDIAHALSDAVNREQLMQGMQKLENKLEAKWPDLFSSI